MHVIQRHSPHVTRVGQTRSASAPQRFEVLSARRHHPTAMARFLILVSPSPSRVVPRGVRTWRCCSKCSPVWASSSRLRAVCRRCGVPGTREPRLSHEQRDASSDHAQHHRATGVDDRSHSAELTAPVPRSLGVLNSGSRRHSHRCSALPRYPISPRRGRRSGARGGMVSRPRLR